MDLRGRTVCIWLVIFAGLAPAMAEAPPKPPKAILPPADRQNATDVASALWTNCLNEARQVVLTPTDWQCTDKSNGEKLLLTLDPDKFDRELACGLNNKSDLRRLPTGIIQLISKKIDEAAPEANKAAIQKNGIRIIGAVFCQDEVNLSDLTLAYPLVLDRSVFKFGVRARNLNIGGNLSFAASYVYENFDISNSKIGGTLFGRGSFIQKTRITDTEVRDSLNFNNSILLDYFTLARVKTGGGVDFSSSKLSSLSIRQSPIAERLDLTGSEASCKYLIEKSELNEILATNFGFGKMVAKEAATGSSAAKYRSWARNFEPSNQFGPAPLTILNVPTVKTLVNNSTECTDPIAQFGVIESSARSICLQDFHWTDATPNAPLPSTLISFRGVNVINNMRLHLWPRAQAEAMAPEPGNKVSRMLELVATQIGTFFFDFNDNDKPYRTSIDQLRFDRVHAADAGCGAYPNEAEWQLPASSRITDWLMKNKTASLQPFVAFIKAFENAGADTTDLKIAKAQFEFTSDFEAKLKEIGDIFRNGNLTKIAYYSLSLKHPIDAIRFSMNYIAGKISDFGFRPYKSVIYIGVAVLIFYLLITRWLRVTHAKSETRAQPVPVNAYFIIDWMIPVYNLDPAHSKITGYYDAEGKPIDLATERRLSRILLALRITGVVAAVFLTATLKAFVLN